ncbi:MAG TPA: DUF3822 family protein, partial [Chitinophagaceae bacterium]|nr:DUF3822 family protein [Chitinophagaceae bacterium]
GHTKHLDGEFIQDKTTQQELPIRKWLQDNHELLNLSFSEIHIGVYTDKFTLMPDIGIRNDLALQQLSGFDAGAEDLLTDSVDGVVQICYALPKPVIQLLNDHFSRKTVSFGEIGWINSVIKNQPASMCIHILGSDLLIAAVEDNQIKYLNRFTTYSPDEVLYYILLVYNLLNYDTNSVALHIHGLLEKISPIYQQLYGYISRIFFGEGEQRNTDLHQPAESAHFYTNLQYL